MGIEKKNILIGVTGSIAAYKAALLVRLFVKKGATVRVIMTDAAEEFITPLTLSTLSKHPVYSSFYKNKQTGEWVNHVELGLWADAFIVAPATGNTIAKMATGQSDNLLTATYLSARCPVFVAPAMDLDMWTHPTTKENVQRLCSFGNQMINVGDGELASGLHGEGRLAEPEDILEQVEAHLTRKQRFKEKTVLVSAGPTQEAIDPVRYITNHSSGAMGVAIANAFAEEGATVHLLLGPTSKSFQFHDGVQVHRFTTAKQLFHEINLRFDKADITVMAAAVADYTPADVSESKMKKSDTDLSLKLERTKDILKTIGQRKQAHQLLVGFALETENGISNAIGKLKKKNLDLIVLNSLQDEGAGFQHSTNKVTIIDRFENKTSYELKSKKEVAKDILEQIEQLPHVFQV